MREREGMGTWEREREIESWEIGVEMIFDWEWRETEWERLIKRKNVRLLETLWTLI